MGLFNTGDYTFNNGITLSNLYIMIDNILIRKSNVLDFKYTIQADTLTFVSKDVRQQDIGRYIEKNLTAISTDNLDNLHEQIYAEVKKNYENHTDDL